MLTDPSHAQKYTDVGIERKVSEVLREAYPRGIEIPVDIDFVAEIHPLVNAIILLPDLQDRFNVIASLVCKSERVDIFVDEDTFSKYPARARFSVAHELGHVVLHSGIWQKCHTLDDTLDMQRRIKTSYCNIERMANRFAGAILMPSSQMDRYVRKLYKGLVEMYGFSEQVLIKEKIQTLLAQQCKVSIKPMEIRLGELKLDKKIKAALQNQSYYLEEF